MSYYTIRAMSSEHMPLAPQGPQVRTRKRKSNFDIPPSEVSSASNEQEEAVRIAQAKAKAIASLMASHPNTSSLASVTSFLPDQTALAMSYKKDAAYEARLEKAKEKNINYVKRKDLEMLERQARGDYIEPGFVFLSSKAPRQPRGNNLSKSGLGSESQNAHQQNHRKPTNENTSIYVDGISPDLTEKDLEILFSVKGKIKKIKLYTTSDGKRKGDALVTFTKAEAVAPACLQFNDVNLGNGYTLKVTPASFNSTKGSQNDERASATEELDSAVSITYHGMAQPQEHQGGLGYHLANQSIPTECRPEQQALLPSSFSLTAANEVGRYGNEVCPVASDVVTVEQQLGAALPVESEVYDYPVALIQNVYDGRNYANLDDVFFAELQADMLEECCTCGKVRRVMTPVNPILLGSIAVTFEDDSGARECFVKLNRRWFDSRQLSVRLFHKPPRPLSYTNLSQLPQQLSELQNCSVPDNVPTEANSTNDVNSASVSKFMSNLQNTYRDGCDTKDEQSSLQVDEAALLAAQDTEDFLNSLL